MCCVAAEDHAIQGPLVAAASREGVRPRADDFDAVVGVLDAGGQAVFFQQGFLKVQTYDSLPILRSRMSEIW